MAVDKVDVELERVDRPTIREVWIAALETHCPNCGSKTVWVEDDPGDYYDGPQFCCITCGAFGVKWDGSPNTNTDDARRLEQIRAAVETVRTYGG